MRKVGAVAGLAPACTALAFWIRTGASTRREDFVLFAVWTTITFVAVGWTVGERIRGSYRADLVAAVSYALLVAFVTLVVGAVMAAIEPSAASTDIPTRIGLLLARVAYGLLYIPFWAGFVAPLAVGWVVAVRVIRRVSGRTGSPTAPSSTRRRSLLDSIDPRRAIVSAVVVIAYAAFVAALPLALYREFRPPWSYYRPVALFVLMSLPALIAIIGARSGVRTLMIAAGVVCLGQSFIAFSGVTIGFVVPALLLLVLAGSENWPDAAPHDGVSALAGVGVVGLIVGAWIAFLALTEEVCWSATRVGDGNLVYQRIPSTEVMTIPPGQVAGGCNGGTLTFEALGVGAVLAIGAVAIAILAGTRRQATAGSLANL